MADHIFYFAEILPSWPQMYTRESVQLHFYHDLGTSARAEYCCRNWKNNSVKKTGRITLIICTAFYVVINALPILNTTSFYV